MNLTDLSTRHWPSVAVTVALIALFGGLSIGRLPIQLLPSIEEPQINVANFWRAAAPEEMEASIIEPQENVLKNTPGLTDISSFVSRGAGFINLTFAVGGIDSGEGLFWRWWYWAWVWAGKLSLKKCQAHLGNLLPDNFETGSLAFPCPICQRLEGKTAGGTRILS
jgi:hypothetical protein